MFSRSHRVRTSFAEVAVFEAGDAGAAPILFLHGNPDAHHVWGGVVDKLSATRRCIAPDLPGFGDSDEMHDVTLDGQAKFVAELLDQLKLTTVDLVIHDVGATHGLAFIAARPDNAARVRTLTCFNANFFPDYHWHFWGRVWRTPILGEISMLFGTEALFVQQLQKAAPKLPADTIRTGYQAYGKKARRQVLRFYREADPEKLRGWDTRLLDALRTVKHQVIWGDRDPYITTPNTAERLAANGGTVHHLTDVSHWPMAEEPARVAQLIADFIA